jgi:molybdenum cofactor synthesis domain-containing protein
MDRPPTVDIIAAGNELLLGDVLDTNTNWLCKRITDGGGEVRRAVIVKDELEAIASEIRSALDRRTALIITTGGLGPTGDDITLQAVAEATGRPLRLDHEVLAALIDRYQDLAVRGLIKDSSLTEARKKMAYLPEGARPVANPVGSAPGVIMEIDNSTLISLPGVPEELKAIYEESLPPILRGVFGDRFYHQSRVITVCGDESSLAPILDEVVSAHPAVYIKSRAKKFGPGVQIVVTLSYTGEGEEEVEGEIGRALEHLTTALAVAGIELGDAGQ